MKHYIKGNYRKSIYTGDNGYTIGIFKVNDTNIPNMEDYLDKTVTFTGFFHDLNTDDNYILYGDEIEHPKYGFQFQVEEYERLKPDDKDSLILFLSSDLFKGVGEKLAEKIVNTLGNNALDRILDEENSLMLVPKMTLKKARSIRETLEKYEESHTTIVYLTDLGFSMREALLIYNNYKGESIINIENNIYDLITEIKDITFVKIDQLALKLKYDLFDDKRLKAAVVYAIETNSFQTGDTYFYIDDLYNMLQSTLNISIDRNTYDDLIHDMTLENILVIENNQVFLKILYEASTYIAKKIASLSFEIKSNIKNIDESINKLEEDNNINYNKLQKEAIASSLKNNITVITGGPGTGKTTIIKAIVELYKTTNRFNHEDLVANIALLAPTGRASKRLSEAVGLPASTIHRFLKWNKESNEFAVNEFQPDFSKLIIVDEVSMIDLLLMNNLLKGLLNNVQLVLVGDANQLPSVGAGQVLKDIIDSEMVEVINLEELYRQDENSYIFTLANDIKKGDVNSDIMDKFSDFTFKTCSNDSLKNNLRDICINLKNRGYDENRVQIMAPMYKGDNGIDNLNKELQNVFNPSEPTKNEVKVGDIIYRENDKVLQLVNMPDENIFNGDVGFIKRIVKANISKTKKIEIHIDFDGNEIKYNPKDFVKIKHGYVITIHKSQGSEFEMVVLPLSTSYYRMLYRKLIYTGVTRAKKKLIMLGDPRALDMAVRNNSEFKRNTVLKDKIINFVNNY